MAVKKPIVSKISGPAQTLDEKANVLLDTINHYTIRNDPVYCKKIIGDVEWLYSKSKKLLPEKISLRIGNIKKFLEEGYE